MCVTPIYIPLYAASCCLEATAVLHDQFLSQAEMTDPSGATLSPSPHRPLGKGKKQPILSSPEKGNKRNYTSGGPGPPSSPSSPAPASSCHSSSLSSGSFLLVPMHPTLVLLRNTKTASADGSLHSHLPERALGCFHPCTFPIPFHGLQIWGNQALHSVNRWWRVCCFPPPRHQHRPSSVLPILSFKGCV